MRWAWRLMWFAGALGSLGCGVKDEDAEEPRGEPTDSVVGEEWRSYCVATFARDYTVMDVFGDRVFTARSGEEYLLAEYGSAFGNDEASLLYVTQGGPYEFEVTRPAGGEFPFTSNCAVGATTPYYAAFTNVSVYAEEALSTKLCDLPYGSVVPRASSSSGYSAVTLDFFGPNTYEVFLNAFGPQCGGADRGYVSVPQVELFGTNTWLVPITAIVGPG
ncbi:MAG TPA: hypothetical protein VGK73_30270 [Polyangiaceae bacterium]